MNFTVDQARRWLEKSNEKFQANEDYLTALDQPIGDGDHGVHMAQGFRAVVQTIDNNRYDSVGELLQAAAFTMMTTIGGASGPLFGTAFLKIAQVFQQCKEIDYQKFVTGFEAALVALKQRGKSKLGEKTLIDVWNPVVAEMTVANCFDSKHIVEIAKDAMEKTKFNYAAKGRAAYFMEKSVGHIDPGATSSYYLFEALAEVMEEDENGS